MIRDQGGLDKPKSYDLGKSYYNLLAWTPDGKTIVYQDNHLNLYSIATGTGVSKLIDNRLRRGGFQRIDLARQPLDCLHDLRRKLHEPHPHS